MTKAGPIAARIIRETREMLEAFDGDSDCFIEPIGVADLAREHDAISRFAVATAVNDVAEAAYLARHGAVGYRPAYGSLMMSAEDCADHERQYIPATQGERPYVAMARIGACKVCGKTEDLRMGVCFACCDFVDGEKVGPTTHRLWDRRNSKNEWYCSETGDT